MNMPGKGRVERHGRRAVVCPYDAMDTEDLRVLKQACERYAEAVWKAGHMSFLTWAHGIIILVSRPGRAVAEQIAGEDMAAKLGWIYAKHEAAKRAGEKK
jgi:hypothetical protein